MDPIAHTFFGASVAATGVRKKTRFATAAWIAGANLPDIDAVVTVFGRDTSLLLRRGLTHGVLAMLLLPLLLAAILYALDKRKPKPDSAPDFSLKWILLFSYLATWSHPLLDLMNTYGVRLLMPFDGRWFYGDTLFIIDPWFWLLTGASVLLGFSYTKRSISIWSVLTILATALITFGPSPVGAKILWAVAVLALAMLRRSKKQAFETHAARFGVATLILYIGMVFALARSAENKHWEANPDAINVQSNPQPANPFSHRIVIERKKGYEVHEHGEVRTILRGDVAHPSVQKALIDPKIRGFVNWMRFPQYEIEKRPEGDLVRINDIRYVEPGQETRGIGRTEILID